MPSQKSLFKCKIASLFFFEYLFSALARFIYLTYNLIHIKKTWFKRPELNHNNYINSAQISENNKIKPKKRRSK